MQINTYKNHEYGNKTYVIHVILVLKTVHINTNKQTFKQDCSDRLLDNSWQFMNQMWNVFTLNLA